MALDVTIKNDFSSGAQGKTAYWKKNGGSESNINPGGSTSSTSMNQNDYIQIRTGDLNAYQIRFRKVDGYPKVQVQLTGSTWKTTNLGTNTQVQVEIGPDGQ